MSTEPVRWKSDRYVEIQADGVQDGRPMTLFVEVRAEGARIWNADGESPVILTRDTLEKLVAQIRAALIEMPQ